ncbi:MAG: PaaI family thioesterase [Deltaproteobacteria bacterium]|nr:PaaI family thioesterase [Deltaproteobacteria bacterium]
MDKKKTKIINPKGYKCFACGTANPIGLRLRFYRSGESVCTDITLGKYHVGWENIAHGGIISTILDEVMSWTILYFKRIFFVTRKMELKYIRPVLVGIPLTAKGEVIDGSEPPRIKAKAELRDQEGTLLARSTGEFVSLDKDELTSIPDGLKDEMFSIIGKLPPL